MNSPHLKGKDGNRAAADRFAQGVVRRLVEDDIPRIASLHQRIHGSGEGQPPASLVAHFRRIFLHHPWQDHDLASLVFEEEGGRVIGCLGIMPRPMTFSGRRITAAVSHNFMVEPGGRFRMAALALAKRYLTGPQALSLAEGNSSSLRLWQSFGGSVSLLYSLCWTKPLRPAQYMLSFLGRRGLPGFAQNLIRPASRLADSLPPLRKFRPAEPLTRGEDLQPEVLYGLLEETSDGFLLAPVPDKETMAWQLQALALRNAGSTLHKILVCNSTGSAIGWLVYYAVRGGNGIVAQMGAKQGWHKEVLGHLFHHAEKEGVTSLSGQMDPAFFKELSKSHSFFHNDGGSWMLLHSRRPEIINAINEGAAFLSRLEGEWWINYIHKS